MQAERFTVKYITVQNCFVYLPATWQRQLATKPNAIRITHHDRDFYFSWHSQPSPDQSLRLSATFARALGIQEGDNVLASSEAHPSAVSNVTVMPKSSEDWEIVELQSNKIQESLLNQINIVAVDQQIVVWISKFLSVELHVESVEPRYRYGKLQPFTEITVSFPKKEVKEDKKENSSDSLWDTFKNVVPNLFSDTDKKKEANIEESVENIVGKYSKKNIIQTFRVLPVKRIEDTEAMSTVDSLLRQPYNIFINQRFLPKNFHSGEIYCRVKKVRQNTQFVKATNTNYLRTNNTAGLNLITEVVAKIFVLEEVLKKCSYCIDREYFANNLLYKSVYVSENLRHNLKLKVGAKVTLELIEYSVQPVTAIELFPQNNPVTLEDFENFLKEQSIYDKVLINSLSVLSLRNDKSCIVQFCPLPTSYALIDLYDLKTTPVHVKDVVFSVENEMESLQHPESVCLQTISMRGLRSLLTECKSILELSLGLDRASDFGYDRENILICGKVGSGKTTVGQILKEAFREVPNFVYVHVIDCKSLKGKKVETLHKIFLPAILECVYYQPAILFIDDLDSIAGKILADEENTPDAINTVRTADMLLNLITEYQAVNYVAVVATCISIDKINRKLAAPRGIHLFRTILSVPEFEKEDRMDILQLAMKSKLQISNDVDWNHYGNKTEGWTAQDLTKFVEKAVFSAWRRHVNSGLTTPLIACDEDLSRSLDKSVPMSLQGIDLYSGPGYAWSDIGGLAEVKQSLIELLHWPLKYPELFKNAPIKQQGGVLLYGAPGTGKTMLAGAIAKECGLNFISVKGPELLSKYIGASEEAVRNVFEKANSAKPCVLFFDEFDSLAPRRGHDSTGVTDRVVNQFLAQLDGVEGRQGVAVVAATSRPDLLDPALLRPGRLDKSLLCPLPDKTERKEILTALCESQKLDVRSLDLDTLAAETMSFTGADLNSILSQARITVLEEDLAAVKSHGREISGSLGTVGVTQRHLIDALASTRPSLNGSERAKYDRIYAKFSRAEDFSEDILKNSQRATLA
ncbi:peroxisome biogenesis factor 1 isoform X1 [Neodiprion lecontei]|uniref:Peroxisomal ATPase PEX1 n=1 Tax=Neodiprion lecontei TaxID=441921 RepID=A0A6J0C7M0_NEOLC|nr:peroxisome biogenesis factor 1 isoform X1 [Neodiprion lecontei]